MTEKLKYKVGDKVLVEMVVSSVNGTNKPYRLETSSGYYLGWASEEEFEKSLVNLPPKPKVTQTVMDYYLKYRDRDWVFGTWFSFESMSYEVKNWLYSDKKLRLQRQHALATLIAYGPEAVEVEKEKMYRVKVRGVDQYLRRIDFSNEFEFHEAFPDNLTKQELIAAGFEGVFDNPMFEVEEAGDG